MKRLVAVGAVVALSCVFALPAFCEEATSGTGALLEKKCGGCHPVDRPKSKKKTAQEWESTVKRMVAHGAAMTDEEMKSIVDFLARNYSN